MERFLKSHTKTINLKYHLQRRMINLNHLTDNILYQIFFSVCFKKNRKKTDNPSVKIYVSKIENRIIFQIKTEYYPEILTPETIKLLRSTKSKITKN